MVNEEMYDFEGGFGGFDTPKGRAEARGTAT